MRVVPSRRLLLVAVAGVALAAIWVLLLHRWMDSISPGGETLAECLEKLPEPTAAGVFNQGGNEYLAITGEVIAFPKFPSGPPIYVFDRDRRLVDWTSDSGDDSDWWRRWPGLRHERTISREEMARWPGPE